MAACSATLVYPSSWSAYEERERIVPDTIAATESVLEDAVLAPFRGPGYAVVAGPSLALEQPTAERSSFAEAIRLDRLHAAPTRVNLHVPIDALEEALRKAWPLQYVGPLP